MPENDTPALRARIAAEIRRAGPISIARFMQLAVADPLHGYWQRAATIGTAGDFITAPEISQVFGELLGLWCAVTWQQMGAPSPVNLVELGPGKGTLMRDVLRTVSRAMPQFASAAAVQLVETSEPMRKAQGQALSGMTVQAPQWHRDVSSLPPGPALFLANEFLDALPIRQLVSDGSTWRERVVDTDPNDRLTFAVGAPVEAHVKPGPEGEILEILEIREGEAQLLSAMAERKAPLVALFIDYGTADEARGDTLQAMRRHAYVDPLDDPGSADLTAHVHFAPLERKAADLGFATESPMTQAEFLGALGLAQRASRLMAANPAQAADIELAAQRLVAPTGMGSLFKVLCIRSPSLPKPPPWG